MRTMITNPPARRPLVLDGPFTETKDLVVAPWTGPPRGGYAEVNGLQMYYEVYGRGRPMVLLHGGLTTIDSSFGTVVRALACTRRVIAVEQQAHGRTADIARALSYEKMADDTAELLRILDIDEADVFGFSMGAVVGVLLAVRHPRRVRHLAVVSGGYGNDGFTSGFLHTLCNLDPNDPRLVGPRQEFRRVGVQPDQWDRSVARVREAAGSYRGLRRDQVKSIRAKTLFVTGEAGIVRYDHVREMARLVPRARLEVLSGDDHHPSIVGRSAALLPEFLEEPPIAIAV